MKISSGPVGVLAKVTAIDDDRNDIYFDLRDGRTGSFKHADNVYRVGDVLLLVDDDQNRLRSARKVARDAWPDATWIGIVKAKLPDLTVVESGGRFRAVPTAETPPYQAGNTVQADETQGVIRVISDTPISYISLPEVDDSAIEQFRSSKSVESALGFDDFGGLPEVVARARELIEVPLRNRKALASLGARPIKGVLFTGEPGTGKTMLARIIASQSDSAFYEVSGPQVFSKWYGQSEELLRKLFEKASTEERAIIFFDEIDSVAAQRGDHSHEASKRVVAQLLTLMDGFTSTTNVVVIAATNRPQDLDVALRRPGRFDWEIEFRYPDTHDREDILRKSSRRHRIREPLPHAAIATRSAGWSAAELAQIWSEAALLAVEDQRSEIWVEDYWGGFERVSRYRSRTIAGADGGDGL